MKLSESDKKRCKDLRKLLDDKLYFNPNYTPPSYQIMLSDILRKLTQGVRMSQRQNEVINNAIHKYKMWLVKDQNDPNFISNRSRQVRLIDKLKTHFYDTAKRSDGSMSDMGRLPQQVIPLINSLMKQLFTRKMLLTNKQKLYCNNLYKEITEINIKRIKENA